MHSILSLQLQQRVSDVFHESPVPVPPVTSPSVDAIGVEAEPHTQADTLTLPSAELVMQMTEEKLTASIDELVRVINSGAIAAGK